MPQHDITTTWARQGESFFSKESVVADAEFNADLSVAGLAADQELEVAFDFQDLKSIVIISDKPLTLKTNSVAAPGDTIAIPATASGGAGVPFKWTANSGVANPFTADVTSFHFVSAEADAAAVKVRLLFDGTP